MRSDTEQLGDLEKNQYAIIMRSDTEQLGDLEKNVTSEDGATSEDSATAMLTIVDTPIIPTSLDIFIDFNGSLSFVVGSSGFIFSMYFDNWLIYFRYGALVWIYGCVVYSIPLLVKFRGGFSNGCPWGIGDFGQFFCYIFFTVGCILAGFFDEEMLLIYLPWINHMFVYGSFLLTLEPLYQVCLFLKRGGSCRSRIGTSKLCGSPDSDGESVAPLKLQWDRFLELSAITFFCAASVFGVFHPDPKIALVGVYCWGVGSLFCLARSFLMVYERKIGLKGLAI